MREIHPYKTLNGALKALDNGGRFYNVLSKAGDDSISDSELCKAAGVISGRDQAFLFLKLAIMSLRSGHQKIILSQFSADLREQYLKSGPTQVGIGEFDQQLTPGKAVIVGGYPRFLDDHTQLVCFVMVPIIAGRVTSFTMMPIFDQFDVYELFANPQFTGRKTVIATVRGSKHLEPVKTIFGGVVKDLKFEPGSKNKHRYFVETSYYVLAD